MRTIKWTEAMSVGVPMLDQDHQVMVGLITRLREHAGTGKEKVIGEILDTLVAYTELHFYREEKVMEACGYPALALHQSEHRDLEDEVHDLYRQFREGDPELTLESVHEFLVSWLNHHILLNDMHYRRYCEGNPEAERIANSFGALNADGVVAAPG